ncbi:nucleotidyltransferase [Lentilactobacillus senioris]|uniref:nucleotidyltransferase n=1 Tax=Lentilactobacillus senioris TaxID=931534 RepID=UPI0022817C1D|nr:nucleotidyltransferase [Lentilactobacillus senioris]MCY9806948.1 nucleotidyltransferase [Lentilactobacillus senioris]
MKAVAIIAEYNPFHNGHLYQLKAAKEQTGADVVIALLSGNWVQRGEPAAFDKWQRAQLALANGVDLVVELPFNYAVQPAHLFAAGGVKLAEAIHATWLSFGAETPNLDYQKLIANQPDKDQFKQFDQTFATQYSDYLTKATGITVNQSNDILFFSYANAKVQQGADIELVPVQRLESNHQDTKLTTGFISSASAIRAAIQDTEWSKLKRQLPAATYQLITNNQMVTWQAFWPLLRYELVATPIAELGRIYQMTEGIEYRLKQVAKQATSFAEFLRGVKTKRYTYTRIQRLCVYVLMHAYDAEMKLPNDYLRILGFNKVGQAYLNQEKKHLELPLITKVTDDLSKQELVLDYRAGMLRQLITNQPQDFYRHPIINLS